MNLTVRRAIEADLPILNGLYADMDDRPLLPECQCNEIFRAIQSIPDYHIYLVYLEDKAVGTFSLVFMPTMMHRGFHKFAVLDAVAVHSNYRSQRIGKAMMQEALHLCRSAGCYKVTLSSNVQRDRAHAFYQSLGFQQHGWSFSYRLSPDIRD